MTPKEARDKLVARYRRWRYVREMRMISKLERQLRDGAVAYNTLAAKLRDEEHAHRLCRRRVHELEDNAMTLVNWKAMHLLAQGMRDARVRQCAGNRTLLRRANDSHSAVIEFLTFAQPKYAQVSRGEQAGVYPENVT